MSPSFPPTLGSVPDRLELWPGVPVPLPGTTAVDGAQVDGDSVLIGGICGVGDPLPEEFILREALELDPGDLEFAASLACKFGDLFQVELKDLPSFSVDDPAPSIIISGRSEEIARSGWSPLELYHKEEVRLHFEALRFLAETWLAMQVPHGLEELIRSQLTEEWIAAEKATIKAEVSTAVWEHLALDEDGSYETLLGMEHTARLDRFESLLDAGLSIFHIGILAPEQRAPTLYSLACLQLYNLIVERAPIRYCANENCRRGFVHQRGTAQYGQYREAGVKYCSPACGKAQNERERRRRHNRAARR
jgi:hypothetical protein